MKNQPNTKSKTKSTVAVKKVPAKKAAPAVTAAPAADKKKVIKLDWAFRRLRNQAAIFFSGGNKDKKKALMEALEVTSKYEQVQNYFNGGDADHVEEWTKFMNHFFGHRINKQVEA